MTYSRPWLFHSSRNLFGIHHVPRGDIVLRYGLTHHQTMLHSSLTVRQKESSVSTLAASTSHPEVTSVAYRCLRSCLCQQFDFSDTGLVVTGAVQQQSDKFIDMFIKQKEFKTPDGTQKCVYNVYTGINKYMEGACETADAGSTAKNPSGSIRKTSKEGTERERLECSISLIPQAPWKHEDMAELCYLAALRFAFPSAYFSLISAIPSLSPFDEKTGLLKANSSVDVYTPVVRCFLQGESNAKRALEKLLRRLAYFTQESKVISTELINTYELTLSIVSEKPTHIPQTHVDTQAYEQCLHWTNSHAERSAIAAVSGITVKIGEKVNAAQWDTKSTANGRQVTLTMTTNFPAIAWYLLYAEAIRQVDPTVFAVCNDILEKRVVNHLSKTSLFVWKEKKKISMMLRLIFGGSVSTRIGISQKLDSPHRYSCSVISQVPEDEEKRPIVLHHITGTGTYEVLVKMRYFLTSYYVKHVGAHNDVLSNNLYVAENNSIPEATLHELLPVAESVEKSNSVETSQIKHLRQCLQETGDVAISLKEDTSLRSSLLGTSDICPLQVGFLAPVKEGNTALMRACVFIGGDYETTISQCIMSYLKRFHPRIQWKYNMLKSLHRPSLKNAKKDAPRKIYGILGRMATAHSLAPVVLRCENQSADDIEKTDNARLSTFWIELADEANDRHAKVLYDPKNVLRGDSHIQGSQTNALPATRAFFDLHWGSFPVEDKKAAFKETILSIKPTNCVRGIHVLVNRLIKALFSAELFVKTFIHRQTDNIPTGSSTIEQYYRYSPQSTHNGLFSGFAWIDIRASSTGEISAVCSALEKFLGLEKSTEPSFLSLIAAVHNAHSHEQCTAQLDAAILRNMFPEVYSWLKEMTQANATHCKCLPLSFEPSLSFLPDSMEQNRLALMRRSVAEYFGCDRLREVCVRRGCFFDIHLLHPTTNEPTGLSLRGASSPLVGLLRIYRETLFAETHYERFAKFRLAFIARNAVLTKGNTHRTSRSLIHFVSAQLRRQLGFSLYLSREHKTAGSVELKAFGVNQNGQSTELLSVPYLPEKNKKVALNSLLLTLCFMHTPHLTRTATQLSPPGAAPIRCDFTSNALRFTTYLSENYGSKENFLPAPLHPCLVERLLGSLQASIDGTTFSALCLSSDVIHPSGQDGKVFTVKIHLKDNAEIVLASNSSGSPLCSSLRCCEYLLSEVRDGPWKVFAQGDSTRTQEITLKLTKPFHRDEFRIDLPIVNEKFPYLARLLRHCCMAYFGLELQIVRREKSGCELTIHAHGKYRQKLTLCSHSGKKVHFSRLLSESVGLHFPEIMASIHPSKRHMAFPRETKPSDSQTEQQNKNFVARAYSNFSLPPTNVKCTLQLMRTAFKETFKYTPKESVRILDDKEKSMCVEILDESAAVVERHRSRSLPFSLMECYGMNFQQNPVAMQSFEGMEKTHPYCPPSVAKLAEPQSEAVYNLLVYIVRYELGLETICTVEPKKLAEEGGGVVHVVISAVSPKHARAVHLGEELFFSMGMHSDECIARRQASLVALKTHFPIYFRKHGLTFTRGEFSGRKSLEDHSQVKAKKLP